MFYPFNYNFCTSSTFSKHNISLKNNFHTIRKSTYKDSKLAADSHSITVKDYLQLQYVLVHADSVIMWYYSGEGLCWDLPLLVHSRSLHLLPSYYSLPNCYICLLFIWLYLCLLFWQHCIVTIWCNAKCTTGAFSKVPWWKINKYILFNNHYDRMSLKINLQKI